MDLAEILFINFLDITITADRIKKDMVVRQLSRPRGARLGALAEIGIGCYIRIRSDGEGEGEGEGENSYNYRAYS